MSNLKKINEYKRILRQLLDDGGLKGATLKGSSYGYNDTIRVHARASLSISFYFNGQEATLQNDETRAKIKLNLADPASLEIIKKFFNDDLQRIMKGTNGA